MKKSQKNVISRKLQGFEQSYLKARFATPESTLTAPCYRVKKFKFEQKIEKQKVPSESLFLILENNHDREFAKTASLMFAIDCKIYKLLPKYKQNYKLLARLSIRLFVWMKRSDNHKKK